jgi:hypothetical protein
LAWLVKITFGAFFLSQVAFSTGLVFFLKTGAARLLLGAWLLPTSSHTSALARAFPFSSAHTQAGHAPGFPSVAERAVSGFVSLYMQHVPRPVAIYIKESESVEIARLVILHST